MIGRLKGLVDEVGDDYLVVDVGGVGYQVFATRRMLADLPPGGGPIALHIETHVREDHIHLYGFPSAEERRWFRLLTSVQGVGNRVAMAMLGVLSPNDILHALAAQDRTPLTRAEGVGPKLAARILSELKDKAGDLQLGAGTSSDSVPIHRLDPVTDDAISALVNLGYGRSAAFAAVAEVMRRIHGEKQLDVLIPAALKELAR